ncbi:hypothetical protein [Flavobacterium sp. NKUCC04_CG]|uniref:COG1470 family protein n=1 Tax=Flavobacterium sp. NKUCC04_CG TaxID=2842121 RepID=UPI001C5BFBFD|nr:hypothetical protein [Flavobacterium sp. NKUCC04_CG]MBW3517587.1 hypothetical protein [Flavobacterium sp. NKUCC04_CG]
MHLVLEKPYIKRLLLLFLLVNTALWSQVTTTPDISLKTDIEILAANESLVSIVASLKNNSSKDFVGTLDVDTNEFISRVNKGPISIHLAAGESSYLPIKLWVNRQHPAGSSLIKFNVINLNNDSSANAHTTITIAPKHQIRIVPLETQIMMKQVGDSIRASVRVFNNGNQTERIKLIASFPKLAFQNTQQNKEIELKPFTDITIQFSKIIDRELMSLEYFTVNIAALYENNDFIGNTLFTVQNASGDRRYSPQTNNGYTPNHWNSNKISLSARDLVGQFPSYSLFAKNEMQLNKGKLAFSVDGTYWNQSVLEPLFTNTWVEYEENGKGLLLGNIQENELEMNLAGRGIKAYTVGENQEKITELGFIDKTYNLIGASTWDTQGFAAFAKHKFEFSDKTKVYSSVIFDRNYGIDSYIASNNLAYTPNQNWNYEFRLSNGFTGASTTDYKLPYKPSLAVGANIQGNAGAYQLISNNYYSSGYYPGIRKGILSFDERISRSFNTYLIWAGINYYNYRPEYIDEAFSYQNDSENFRGEWGINFSLPSNFRLSIIPQFSFEKGQFFIQPSTSFQEIRYQSYILNETVNWSSKNQKHLLYLSMNQGIARYPFSADNQLIHKTQLTWSFQGFQVSTYFQQGNFMLTEGLFNAFNSNEKLERLSIMPSYRQSFWQERLSINLSAMYSKDTFSGDNYMIAATSEWKAFKNTTVFVSLNQYYYQNNQYETQNSYLQAGISQALPNTSSTITVKKGTIQLFCYYDRNTNGIYDDGDEPAANRIVMINESAFVTQKDGTVKYRGVPYGSYHISLKGKNWMAEEYDENLVSKNLQRSIPLQETGNLRGKFEYVFSQNLQFEVTGNRSGLGVILKNQQGKVFDFKTNDQGEFMAYLPLGTYEITVDHSLLPKNVYTEETSRKLVISKGNSQIIEPIILKVKERKVDIKRFGK